VRVECDEAAVGELSQRIDLGQRHVVVAHEAGKARENRSGPGERGAGDARVRDDLLGAEVRGVDQVREMAAAHVVRVLLGHLLDVDAAHVGEQHQRALARAVPDNARVVLLRDLGLRIDEHALGHVAVDVELEDRGGVLGGLIRGVRELDTAGLHAAAREHL